MDRRPAPSDLDPAADKIQWYYSPNANILGGTTWDFIGGNGNTQTIASSFAGTSAEAVTASGGGFAAPVVLGPDWFAESSAGQLTTMLHEAVHSVTGFTDSDIFSIFSNYGLPTANFNFSGNTEDFSRWLSAGCPPQGK